MFLCYDSVKLLLHPAYSGSFRVISRCDKHLVIDRSDNTDTESLARLKATFLDSDYMIGHFLTKSPVFVPDSLWSLENGNQNTSRIFDP